MRANQLPASRTVYDYTDKGEQGVFQFLKR